MDETMLDGNAVAGMLQEVFAVETTTAMATCRGCGAPTPMGATHVFRGAGFVLRCPHCGNALVTLVQGDTRMWIGFPGIRTLQIPIDAS
jgi:Zn finger protein HypA/HybF involved in hydrogenase expression